VRGHDVIVIGGGIGGLSTAMLLARDGHEVTIVERDPEPPPDPLEAWAAWERRGVTQFRLPHLFLSRFRELLDTELPDVVAELTAVGALRFNPMSFLPTAITGGYRPGDERFEQITGRRPMVEAAFARLAAREPGVRIRRGVAVRGLLRADARNGDVPHVAGIVTGDGEQLSADLVVDCGGRRSALPEWLTAIGARRPPEEVADCGFVYYGRHYRSADGALPAMFGPPLQAYDSVTTLTLVADNGHWSVVVTTSAKDQVLRRARDVDVWERIVRSYPLIAHWIDAAAAIPITGIDIMAGIPDRVRHFDVDGDPIAAGVVAVGDASACTNPSVGRGASIALLHAVCLRDVLRKADLADPVDFARQWNDVTAESVDPLVGETLHYDRHRLAQIDAQIAGVPYETEDPAWNHGQALRGAGAGDPELLRAGISVASLLTRGVDVFARPDLLDRLRALGPPAPPPGPSRAELVGIVEAAR
jgi:2-polyprenyl-6-methoxyphenol hydroxylase-like FAD-dependent oxidoreductase